MRKEETRAFNFLCSSECSMRNEQWIESRCKTWLHVFVLSCAWSSRCVKEGRSCPSSCDCQQQSWPAGGNYRSSYSKNGCKFKNRCIEYINQRSLKTWKKKLQRINVDIMSHGNYIDRGRKSASGQLCLLLLLAICWASLLCSWSCLPRGAPLPRDYQR